MSDSCDVCGAPATYWQRYAGHWDDECMDRCGRHKPARDDPGSALNRIVVAVPDDWTPPTTSEEWGRMSREAFMRQRGVEPPTDRATQIERILRDLIEEIKEEFIELPDGATESCVHPCVYRAEARLRALQTPGGPAGADLKEGEGSGDA